MAPALFVNAASAMRLNREEVLGPVARVIRMHDYDEALAVANDTEFSLSPALPPPACHTPRISSATRRPAW